MPPAAKRRRRNTKLSSSASSESEDGSTGKTTVAASVSPPSGTSKKGSLASKTIEAPSPVKARTANHPSNAAPIHLPNRPRQSRGGKGSVAPSPEKAKGTRSKAVDKVKSGNISALFLKQAQRQPLPTTSRVPSTVLASTGCGDTDIISDEDSHVNGRQALTGSFVGATAKKRARDIGNDVVDLAQGSQKFMRKSTVRDERPDQDLTRPWAEQFQPANLDELAVHKKKVADVRGWLEAVMEGTMRQRLLVLKGAAGTGKTTTVNLLAKAMGCQILEWRNPIASVPSSDGFVSVAAQFEDFMGRGSFGQLELYTDGDRSFSMPDDKPLDRRKRVLLIEEFPNTFQRSSIAMQSFRSAIMQYLAANTPTLSMMYAGQEANQTITPVIMIISEALLTTSSASADSFTAHRLLGPEILRHPGVSMMEFNAIAPTLLAKALDLVVVKESRKSGRRKTPGPAVLKQLCELGDVRSAIGSLEFLCVRGDETGDWSAKVAFSKGKKVSRDTPMTSMEQESLELITRREASLGIFHAVGKVVYNKRDDVRRDDDVEDLPAWLKDRSRPKRSQVTVDQLIDETGTETQTFVAALHENYVLSCEADAASVHGFTDMDHINGCINALSDADLLCPSWNGSLNASGFGGGTGARGSGGDILRQDELYFQVAVRGVLFALPCPVKRRAPAAGSNGSRPGRGGDAFKMFYPTSLKLWRAQEEIEGMIDVWQARLLTNNDYSSSSGTTNGAAAFVKGTSDSVERWKQQKVASQGAAMDNPASSTSVGLGISIKKDLILERLPYMAFIAKARKGGTSPIIREMEKVTAFVGSTGGNDADGSEEEPVGADMTIGEAWTTDKPGEGEQDAHTRRFGCKKSNSRIDDSAGLEKRFAEQKLVLSDDDIEDD